MFRVKVTGTYVARSGVMEKEKVKKSYEIEGNIPTTYAALSIVKNKLLGPALTAKYPDYVTFLTFHIIEITPLDAKSKQEMKTQEISFMDRPALIQFIRDNGLTPHTEIDPRTKLEVRLGIIPEYYPNLFRLREAVQMAKDDPYGYAKHFALKEPDLKLDLEMAKCNPNLFKDDSEGTEGIIASTKLHHPPPIQELDPGQPLIKDKASSPSALAKKTEDRLGGLTADLKRTGDMGEMDPIESTDPVEPPDVGDL